MTESFYNIQVCKGIDNVSDKVNLKPTDQGMYFFEVDNIDIDNFGKLHRRDGYGSQIIDSTNIHSFWSNGDLALYVDGTNFKKLNTDYTSTTLITDIDPTDRICFKQVGKFTFFSSHSIVGYILDNLPYPFPATDIDFKNSMVGGQHLEFYNNRLYAALYENLFFSDATVLMRMDKRKNAIAFTSYITFIGGVLDGIYVGTDTGVIFLKGSDPIIDFAHVQLTDNGVIDGTGLIIDDEDIGRGAKGKVAYWVARDGAVYRGLPGGLITQIHKLEGFKMDDLDMGTSILKKDHGYKQYLALCQIKAGKGGVSGEATIPLTTIQSGG